MKTLLGALAAAMVLAVAAPAVAQSPRDAALVSVDWLAQHASDPNLVILHVGDERQYQAGHIPGARHVAANALAVTGPAPGNLMLEMPDSKVIEERLEALGVSDNSHVVVVYTGQLPAATRVVFTVEIAGLGNRVALLDGGQAAWVAAGKALTPDVPAPATPGALTPFQIGSRIVNADFVRTHLAEPGYKVIDARASNFYSGAQAGGSQTAPQPRGHVMDALSVPFNSLTDPDGTYKSTEELRAIFAQAGVRPGDKLIVYCHVGQQATAVILGARSLGIETLLYDGSYQDWSNRQLPVEAAPAA